MSEQGTFLELIILGSAAVLLFMMLRNMMGRNSGDEDRRPPMRDASQTLGGDNVTPINQEAADSLVAERPVIEDFVEAGTPLAQTLTEIQLADRQFDPEYFIDGARGAYEMIVEAFAAGDRKTLKSLLSDEVYGNFNAVIEDRASRNETVETTFVGINAADITNASLVDRTAQITLRFVSEMVSATKNADGAVIDGDPNMVFKVTDIWTFARDVKASDPNWRLVATASG